VDIVKDKPIPPGYWGLCEAVLETRNILRSLAAAREHSTIPKAQAIAKIWLLGLGDRQTPADT